ncbi:hypothetical protein BH20VER2_BH20VER2_06490 [soil metagenome]|nr:DUF4097 family beta strand repeat protein [Chthoniobacterales bacterium]
MLTRFAFISLALAFTVSSAWSLSEERVNKEFNAPSGGKLVVDVSFGSIELTGGNDDKVVLEAYRKIHSNDEQREKEYFAQSPIVVTQEGNTVTVRSRPNKDTQRWNWSGSISMDARYTVRVPKTFSADLRTSGGAVSANGLTGEIKADTSGGKLKFGQLKGRLDARTSGGSITLEGCDGPQNIVTSGGEIDSRGGSGNLDARTSGGSIAVRGFSGDTIVKTSGGALSLHEIKGSITGKTSAGSINATLVDPVPGDVRLESSAGSISVAVPAKAGLDVEAKTSMGRVRTEIPMLASRSDDDRLSGTLNGGGKSLYLRASVGSISIKPASSSNASR